MKRLYVFLTFLVPSYVFAGGLQLSSLGIKSFGMGGAYVAVAHDASSVFYNPGAMSFTEKSSISIGSFLSNLKTNYLSPYNGNVKSDDQLIAVYHLYFNYKINKKFAAGISVNNPFSSDMKWADDWEGRYVVQELKLKNTYIQPTLSYKISDQIGIGAGLVYGLCNLNFRRALPIEGSASFGEEELKASSSGIGFNTGIFVKLLENLNVALHFRSSIEFNLNDGTAAFSDIPSSLTSEYPTPAKFNSTIKMPSVITGAIAYNFTDQLVVSLQGSRVSWSSFDSLNYVFPDNSAYDIRTGRNSKNSYATRLGAEYTFTDQFQARIGFAWDQSPVPDEYLSPELPDATKVMLAVGASYKFNKKLSGDFTFGIENYFERKGFFLSANFKGSYNSTSNILGVGLNYDF